MCILGIIKQSGLQRAYASRFLIEGNERAICSLIFVYNYNFCHSNSIDGILGAIRDLIHVLYNRKRMDADVQVWWKAVSKQCFFASDSLNRVASLSSIVIQRRIQRIHSILSAKTVCLLFSISVYFLFGYLELISSATTRVSIPLTACTLLRLPLWGNIAQCCTPQLNHNTQLEQMKSNKQGLLMVFESF